MKKIISALIVSVLVILSCIPVSAESEYVPKTATAVKATAIIDGEAEEIWQKTEVLEANLINKTIIYNPESESTATASVRLLWDEKYLYVFAEVLDADPNPENKTGSPEFIPDGIEIQVDEQNDKTGKNNVQSGNNEYAGSWQVFANGHVSGFGAQYTAGEGRFRWAVKLTPSGYNVEMAIPWNKLSPQVGTRIGLEIQINDNITGKAREGLVTWNSDACLGWQDTEAMGEITFLDSPEGYVPPETTDETVITEPAASEPVTTEPASKPETSAKPESTEKPGTEAGKPATGSDTPADAEKGLSPVVVAVIAVAAAAVIAVVIIVIVRNKRTGEK